MNNPETPATRRDQIGRRIDAIGTRIEELKEQRHAGPSRGAGSNRLAAAQRHAAQSQAAAEQAITSSINAFRRAAETHDILAAAYERLAAPGAMMRSCRNSWPGVTGQPPPQTGSEPNAPNRFSAQTEPPGVP